ncbi:MAG: diguanylate cyclase [Thermodesulfobacteriota bacterium]
MLDNDELLENITINEGIAKKLFEIEVVILSIGNFKDLFEKLLLLIEEKFRIPHVWISIISGNDISDLLKSLESSQLLKERLNIVKKDVFLNLIKNEKSPILVNSYLRPFYQLLPKNEKYFAKSLAIMPLVLDGNVIGSLNLGDFSGFRFQPSMDTFFLSQISVKISICLSNVIAREKLNYLATRDSLTGLFNRKEMKNILERELSRANRYDNPLSLLFIDCDDFKMVNDSYGHSCGDALLKYIADQIIGIIRRDDTASRLGGDEFVIILPNQNLKEASKVVERLNSFFNKNPLKYQDAKIPVSFSCGIASTEDPELKTPAALLNKADERLYENKKQKAKI